MPYSQNIFLLSVDAEWGCEVYGFFTEKQRNETYAEYVNQIWEEHKTVLEKQGITEQPADPFEAYNLINDTIDHGTYLHFDTKPATLPVDENGRLVESFRTAHNVFPYEYTLDDLFMTNENEAIVAMRVLFEQLSFKHKGYFIRRALKWMVDNVGDTS